MNNKITDIKKILLNKINECYCIKLNSNQEVLDKIAQYLETGIKMVQLEIGNISTKEFIINARKIHQLCSIYNALFIVKNRADLCKILDCDGICLDDNEIEIKNAKEIIGDEKLISRQIQNIQEFDLSSLNEINYIIQDKDNLDALNRILDGSNIKIITIKR